MSIFLQWLSILGLIFGSLFILIPLMITSLNDLEISPKSTFSKVLAYIGVILLLVGILKLFFPVYSGTPIDIGASKTDFVQFAGEKYDDIVKQVGDKNSVIDTTTKQMNEKLKKYFDGSSQYQTIIFGDLFPAIFAILVGLFLLRNIVYIIFHSTDEKIHTAEEKMLVIKLPLGMFALVVGILHIFIGSIILF